MVGDCTVIFLACLGIGLIAGFFMHRSDFCLAGTFRDLFLFRSTHRLGALILLMTVSGVLFELFRQCNWLPQYPFPWFAAPSWANVLGGVMFGVGMVLAGGCVVGLLYKAGSGSTLSVVAVLGMLVGSGLYAEIHPIWSPLSRQMALTGEALTLPQLSGTSPAVWAVVLTVASALLIWRWWQYHQVDCHRVVDGYVPLWQTAIVLAILGLASVMVTGVPLGVTTSYAKMAAILESWVAPGHVAGLAYFNSQPAQLILPLGQLSMAGGGGPGWDVVALIQYPLVIGIVIGAMISARRLGEFRLRFKLPKGQVLMVFCGGLIMALGSRMTPGCNVWHLLGGLPILSLQSLLFLLGLLPGAWLGSRWLKQMMA